jgi:hypothetical protein
MFLCLLSHKHLYFRQGRSRYLRRRHLRQRSPLPSLLSFRLPLLHRPSWCLRLPQEHSSSRHQLAPLCPAHRRLHHFRRSLRRGQRVWDRRTTTFERSRSRSQQHLPLTPFLLLPRLLQFPARRLSHLLRPLRVPRHQLGTFSARTPATTTLSVSLCDLRESSLLRRQILPFCLRLSLLFCACCQMGR